VTQHQSEETLNCTWFGFTCALVKAKKEKKMKDYTNLKQNVDVTR